MSFHYWFLPIFFLLHVYRVEERRIENRTLKGTRTESAAKSDSEMNTPEEQWDNLPRMQHIQTKFLSFLIHFFQLQLTGRLIRIFRAVEWLLSTSLNMTIFYLCCMCHRMGDWRIENIKLKDTRTESAARSVNEMNIHEEKWDNVPRVQHIQTKFRSFLIFFFLS